MVLNAFVNALFTRTDLIVKIWNNYKNYGKKKKKKCLSQS